MTTIPAARAASFTGFAPGEPIAIGDDTIAEEPEDPQAGLAGCQDSAAEAQRLISLAVEDAPIQMDGYDLKNLKGYDVIYQRLIGNPAELARYQADGYDGLSKEFRDKLAEETGVRFSAPIDVRAMKTLIYLATPISACGAGMEQLRVDRIARGSVSERNMFETHGRTEEKHLTPHHWGEAIAISQVDTLRGTRFVYQQKDNKTPEVVAKQKLSKMPIQVAWQDKHATIGGTSVASLAGASFAEFFDKTGATLPTDALRNALAEQGIDTADDCVLVDRTVGSTARKTGQCSVEELAGTTPGVLGNGGLFQNALTVGAGIFGELSRGEIPAEAITTPGNPLTNTGSALIKRNLGVWLSGDSSKQAIVNAGFRHLEPLLHISQFSLADLTPGDSDGVLAAIGRGWIEARTARALPALTTGTMLGFQTDDSLSYDYLFLSPEPGFVASEIAPPGVDQATVEQRLTELAAAPDTSPKLREFLRDIGSAVVADAKARLPKLDTAFAIARDPNAGNPSELFDGFLAANEERWQEIGERSLAQRLSNERSTQTNLEQFFRTGSVPLDERAAPLIDLRQIEINLTLQPGDLRRIFVENRGREVLERIGSVAVARGLLGQAESLANAQFAPILSGQFFEDRLNEIKSNVDAYVRNVQSTFENAPNQLLGSLNAAWKAQLGTILQANTDAINARLSAESANNQFEQWFGPFRQQMGQIEGIAGQLTSVLPPDARDSIMEPLADINAQLNSIQLGVQLTPPSEWSAGQYGAGDPAVYGMSSEQFVEALQAQLFTEDWSLQSFVAEKLGLPRIGEEVMGQVDLLTGTFDRVLATVGATRATFDPRRPTAPGGGGQGTGGGGGGSGSGSNTPKVTLDREAWRNFFKAENLAHEALDVAGLTDFRESVDFLLFRDKSNVTTDDWLDFVIGTSSAVMTRTGAQDYDVLFGLNAARPFIKVLAGDITVAEAMQAGAMDQAFGMLYGFVGQLNLADPTLTAAANVVMEELFSLAQDSLRDPRTFVGRNSPEEIMGAVGILPQRGRESAAAYAATVAERWQDFGNRPHAYDDVMAAALAAKGLDGGQASALIDYVAAARTLPADVETGVVEDQRDRGQLLNLPDLQSKLDQAKLDFIDERSRAIAATVGDPVSNDPAERARFETSVVSLRTNLGIQSEEYAGASSADQQELDTPIRAFLTQYRTTASNATSDPKSFQEGVATMTDQSRAIGQQAVLFKTRLEPDAWDVHVNRLTSRLTGLGMQALDQQIEQATGLAGVASLFYGNPHPDEAALQLGWQAVQQYVNLPPEFHEALSYFGGDPIAVAKTFQEGRATTAFMMYGTSKLFNVFHDSGLVLAIQDVLIANFGASDQMMRQWNAEADARVDASIDQLENHPDLLAGGPISLTDEQRQQLRDSAGQWKASYVQAKEQDPVYQETLRQRRADAQETLKFASLDYAATQAIRAASGNQLVTMNGFSKTMTQGSGQEKALYLVNTLSIFTGPELFNYIQDAEAAYAIYDYLHPEPNTNVYVEPSEAYFNEVNENLAQGPDERQAFVDQATAYAKNPPAGAKAIPYGAILRISDRLGQLIGVPMAPVFVMGLISLAQSNFDVSGRAGNLPSMGDVLSSPSFQQYVANWLDQLTGLPIGTAFTAFQLTKQLAIAAQSYASATAQLALVTAVAGSAGAGASAAVAENAAAKSSAVAVAAKVGDAAAAPAQSNLEVVEELINNVAKERLKDLAAARAAEAGKALAGATAAVATFVIDLVFGKHIAALNDRLGLPQGTLELMVNIGVSAGIYALLGIPFGWMAVALMVVFKFLFDLLSSLFGLNKKPKITSFSRTFWSACGVYPGFPDESLDQSALAKAFRVPNTPLEVSDAELKAGHNGKKAPLPDELKDQAPREAVATTKPAATPAQQRAAATANQTAGSPASGTTTADQGRPLVGPGPTLQPADPDAPAPATEAAAAAAPAGDASAVTNLGYQVCPATFEANSQPEIANHIEPVSRYKISSLIGNLLYLPDRIRGGASENPDALPDQWFIRPQRIQSYGESRVKGERGLLGKLISPQFEAQIDRLYAPKGGSYANLELPFVGIGANDKLLQWVVVSW